MFLSSLHEADTSASESLQRVVRIAATASGTRYAQVSLVGTSQFVPASHGLTHEPAQQHTPISDSLCSITMAARGTLSVPDTRAHQWTRDGNGERGPALQRDHRPRHPTQARRRIHPAGTGHYLFPAAAPTGGDWIDWIELPTA